MCVRSSKEFARLALNSLGLKGSDKIGLLNLRLSISALRVNRKVDIMCEKQKEQLLKTKSSLGDTLVDSCNQEHFDATGDVYIKYTAKLYERSNGSRYINVDWFVSGCQTISKEFNFPAPCDMKITIWVSEPITLTPIVHSSDSCSASGSEVIDVPSSGDYRINMKLEVKCYAYLVPFAPKSLVGTAEDSCYCDI
ncbi:MAG: hypothetical protein SCH66_00470 [Methanolobus sp.]|nr:hypothetical protein [Methanolobus sp.]